MCVWQLVCLDSENVKQSRLQSLDVHTLVENTENMQKISKHNVAYVT